MRALDKKIVFQGVRGAHSDLACRTFYPYSESFAVPTFDRAIRCVEQGEADVCMIPIENSSAGRVAEIHYLLPETSLFITGEHFLPVRHCLAGARGATADTIKIVHSHPQALMQCRKRIEEMGLVPEAAANTALAAERVAREGDVSRAVICSRLAVELYGLEVILHDAQDDSDNTTVFVTMEREPQEPDPAKGAVLTSLLFEARNIPAALYKALGGFATNQVNMLKLESYIPGGSSQRAHFFTTFEGSPAEAPVRLALEELGFFCNRTKPLGSYYADPKRGAKER
ncbi:MAG: prephenate dehydratase domain-containing protein [Rickettsiales bacterium]